MTFYLPPYLTEIREMSEILAAEAPEFEKQNEHIFDVTDQLFVTTATWGLDRWETILNVRREASDGIDIRRARLLTKMSNIPPITSRSIERAVNAFLKHPSAEVRLTAGRYHFLLTVNGEDLQYIPSIIQTVDHMKPAHLAYTFRGGFYYTFRPPKNDHNRLVLRSKNGFFGTIPVYLDGQYQLDDSFYLNGFREIDGLPRRFRQQLLLRHKKQQNILAASHLVIRKKAEMQTEQKPTVRMKTGLSKRDEKRHALTLTFKCEHEMKQTGTLEMKEKWWTLNGAFLLDGTKQLAATTEKIAI
ncbi:YmfQ family protein [Bacillus sp. z60-18]|uniref:YmfQ family protein n=1 Tax=unclassified Bacillus (in: firmicutes) TaxID=185979 RepID=UPI00390C473F